MRAREWEACGGLTAEADATSWRPGWAVRLGDPGWAGVWQGQEAPLSCSLCLSGTREVDSPPFPFPQVTLFQLKRQAPSLLPHLSTPAIDCSWLSCSGAGTGCRGQGGEPGCSGVGARLGFSKTA